VVELRFFTELHPPAESVVVRVSWDGWDNDHPGVFTDGDRCRPSSPRTHGCSLLGRPQRQYKG